MVYTLTLNSIFHVPLCPQALSFFSLACRTIALLSVFSVKLMSVFTMRFARVYRAYISGIHVVCRYCYRSKVCGGYAISVATNMVNNQSCWDVTIKDVVRNTMSASWLTPKKESPVSIFIKWACPQVTISVFNPLAIEPFCFLNRKFTHSTLFAFNTFHYIP